QPLPPKPAGEQREKAAIGRNDTIGQLADPREARHAFIQPKRPAPANGESPKDRFGAAGHATIRLDQMNGGFELFACECWKLPRAGVPWKRQVTARLPGRPPPARDPATAERAVAVKYKTRPVRRPGDEIGLSQFSAFDSRLVRSCKALAAFLPS